MYSGTPKNSEGKTMEWTSTLQYHQAVRNFTKPTSTWKHKDKQIIILYQDFMSENKEKYLDCSVQNITYELYDCWKYNLQSNGTQWVRFINQL